MRLVLVALLCLMPVAAHAQASAVVLSLGGDAPEGPAREARVRVASVLEGEGASVVPDADVAMRISPTRLTDCRAAACAVEIAGELEAERVYAVSVWMREGAPGSVTVSVIESESRSHSASAEVGEAGLLAAVDDALTQARGAQTRAAILEGPAVRRDPEDEEPEDPDRPTQVEQPTSPLQTERSLEEWILPSVLGVVGLALVGFSVYALLEEQCTRRSTVSDLCLAGSSPNIGLGVTFAIVGTLSIAGAIIWLIVGGQPPEMEQIDVVFGPDGGGVQWRGNF